MTRLNEWDSPRPTRDGEVWHNAETEVEIVVASLEDDGPLLSIGGLVTPSDLYGFLAMLSERHGWSALDVATTARESAAVWLEEPLSTERGRGEEVDDG